MGQKTQACQMPIKPRLLDHTARKINLLAKRPPYPKCSRRETEKEIDFLRTSPNADAKTMKIMKVRLDSSQECGKGIHWTSSIGHLQK